MAAQFDFLSEDTRPDFEELLRVEIAVAARFLSPPMGSATDPADANFLPFAAYIDPAGELTMLGTYAEAQHDITGAFVEQLVMGLRRLAGEGRVRSCCVCQDVKLRPSPDTQKLDAIMVSLEHANGECVTLYATYTIQDGECTFGQQFLAPGQYTVFESAP